MRAALVVIALALATPARAELIDRIMAVVGGQPITLSDVSATLQFRLVQPPAGTRDPLAFALDRAIERSLMLVEVDRFQPPEPAPVEITLRVDELEQRAGSAEAFTRALGVTGLTRDQLRQLIRDDLRIETYLNQRFGSNPNQAERRSAIANWIVELKRRAEINVLYQSAAR